jgi:hypothetical protein
MNCACPTPPTTYMVLHVNVNVHVACRRAHACWLSNPHHWVSAVNSPTLSAHVPHTVPGLNPPETKCVVAGVHTVSMKRMCRTCMKLGLQSAAAVPSNIIVYSSTSMSALTP